MGSALVSFWAVVGITREKSGQNFFGNLEFLCLLKKASHSMGHNSMLRGKLEQFEHGGCVCSA